MSNVQRDLERMLMKSGTVDQRTAQKFQNQATAIGVVDAVTGTTMSIATPAIAASAGVGVAATAGTAALAALFPLVQLLLLFQLQFPWGCLWPKILPRRKPNISQKIKLNW